MPRLHVAVSRRELADEDARVLVEALPHRRDWAVPLRACKKDCDVVPSARERKGHEGRRRADAVSRIAEQLVGDERHSSLVSLYRHGT